MLLKAENLHLRYVDGKNHIHAVNNVNLKLPDNGIFGILGPSGSGKTSLLYLLSGLKTPTQGKVLLDGLELPPDSSQRSLIRREFMGFVFQFHFLINYLNVLENVLVGGWQNNDETILQAKELLVILGLGEVMHRMPHTLSGGQRQRVAIARAFLNKPKIVFVDEPTASLDHKAGKQVMDLLTEFSKDACVLVVTHDESILGDADGIFEMWDGTLKTKKTK